MKNYKSFIALLENKRENKIEKTKNKIKKFLNIPEVIDWIIEKCISERSIKGIQYAPWLANYVKEYFIDVISELHEQNKEDILQNLKNPTNKEIVNLINDEFDVFKETLNNDINYVLDWFKSPLRTDPIDLSELSFDDAYKKSEEWHNSLKATGKIEDESGEVIIEFDDGYYWIDLQTTSSRDEGNAMGHCGTTNQGDTLISLRDKNKTPHVTVAWDSKERVIYQMKGKQNRKPVEKYHPYIYRFLVDPELKPRYFGYEWNKEEDFNLSDFDKETFNNVFEYNPTLIYRSVDYDYRLVNGLLEKEYLEKEDIKNILINSKGTHIEIIMELLKSNNDILTNEEIKELFNKHDLSLENYGELPKLILFNEGIISKDKFASYFSDLFVDDSGNLLIKGDEDELEPFMSDGVESLLFDDDPFRHWDYPYYEMDTSDQVWDNIKLSTKERIINMMVGNTIDYKYYRCSKDRYFSDVVIDKSMFKLIDNEYYFIYNDEKYKIDLILDENKYGDLSEIYNQLSFGLNEAQRIADEGEYYNEAKKSLEKVLGTILKRDSIKISKNRYIEVLIFDFYDIIDLNDMISNLEEEYGYQGTIDYEAENYGSFWSYLREYNEDEADINDDYGLYGSIDKETLDEYVNNRLNWI